MVNQMKRLSVFAAKADTDEIIEKLMWCKCVEVGELNPSEYETEIGISELYSERLSCDSDRAEWEKLSSDIDTVLISLRSFVRKKNKNAVPSSTRDEFLSSGRFESAKDAVYKALEIIESKNRTASEITKLNSSVALLGPWKTLDIPLSISESRNYSVALGSFPSSTEFENVKHELEDGNCCTVELVHEDNTGFYCSVIYHTSSEDEVTRILSQNGFLRAALSGYTDTAEAEAEKLTKKIEDAENSLTKADEELKKLLPAVPDIEILGDIAKTKLAALGAKSKLHESRSTVLIKGWVPDKMKERVGAVLEGYECAYEFSDPTEEDDVPILLDNPGIAKPFEEVLGLYSLPKYRTFDPTVIMGIFYFIIFGMMFADVGYGLLLTVACIALLKIMKPKEGSSLSNLVKLFAICGVSSTLCGIIFGGYLGDLPATFANKILGIENFPELALWFNPLNEPMLFLVASLVIGGVHLLTGMAIQMILIWKSGHPFAAIFDVGSWFLLFGGLGLFFIIGMPGAIVAGIGVLMLILTQGRAEKNIIMKFLKGLLSLYNLVNYAADLLSYSRILALGLAASVIASVINMLATMGGPSGLVFGVIILILGHALNLVINLLGTFVHTSRLQYIEFFGKFYEDGGRPFAPLLPVTDYIDK